MSKDSRIRWSSLQGHIARINFEFADLYRIRLKANTKHMTDDEYEYRYEERDYAFTLREWHNGVEKSTSGPLGERPEWVSNIIDIARIGNHLKVVAQPPPDCICWFSTDADHNLIQFIELS